MSDPYKVLGIPSTATDEEVKAAYRVLARKYHPDNYVNNPLAELATEKMKEINSAYETIKSLRESSVGHGYHGGYQNHQSGGGQYDQQHSAFGDIRRMLQNGMISQAQELLDGVPPTARDAEWHYLKGVIFYNRGWVNDALQYFRKACDMDPGNIEYVTTLNQLLARMNQERQRSAAVGMNSGCCSPCGICGGLLCADCTCSTCRCCF